MRVPTTKDIAQYFRLALETGLCRENEIGAWSDTMIAEISPPIPDWMLNLSIEGDESKNTLLQAVPGQEDELTVWSLLLARCGIASRNQEFSQEQILMLPSRCAISRKIPKPFLGAVYRLFNSYDCCSKEQYNKDFEDFFVPVRHFEASLPPLAPKALQ